jgi:ABC-type Mn2+/Zn2+ transport system ATPase subunit
MLTDVNTCVTSLNEYIHKYNDEHVNDRLDLDIFSNAIEHITSIMHALQLDIKNILMIGNNGCGKKSMIKLACYILNIKLNKS